MADIPSHLKLEIQIYIFILINITWQDGLPWLYINMFMQIQIIIYNLLYKSFSIPEF